MLTVKRAKSGKPSSEDLKTLFLQKYGEPESTGWAPRRRFRFGYYLPADVYECLVCQYVTAGCEWLDVGGGHAVFPNNPELAHSLVSRAARVVAVDPSDNVTGNSFVHETVTSTLEAYVTPVQFDLATARMVVEHVADAEGFVAALSRLVRPGGVVIVLTVNLWSPITIVSRLLPFKLHYPIKRLFWGGEAEDTFPVQYRMNTRNDLLERFTQQGFTEELFIRADDLSMFGRFRWLNYLELLAWRGLKTIGVQYPEQCLLGVYRRQPIRS